MFITYSLLTQRVPFPRSNGLLITSFEDNSRTSNKRNKKTSQISLHKTTTWVGKRSKIPEGNFLYLCRDRRQICELSLTAKGGEIPCGFTHTWTCVCRYINVCIYMHRRLFVCAYIYNLQDWSPKHAKRIHDLSFSLFPLYPAVQM